MRICRDCKNHRVGADGMCTVDYCASSRRGPDRVNPVTGKVYKGKHKECAEVNPDGDCGMFERASWMQRFLILIGAVR